MQLILKRIILFLFLTIFLSTNSWSEIKFKTVTVSAAGLSYEEALNNAFAEAIAMVNGKNIQTKTIIQVLSGDPLSKEIAQDKKQVGFLADLLSQFNKPEKKEKPKEEKKNSDKVEYSQNYLKEIIDETKGGIKSYEIIKKETDKNGWHNIKLKAEVAFFDLPKEAMRVRMAIFPFKLYDVEGDKSRFNRLIDQNINDYFVQTKKFTMLDRTYIEEVAKEQSTILDGKTPAIEMAKIGNEISADFILVGSVENFNIIEKVKKILSSDMEIKKKEASIYMSYRLLDVATKQISYSNTIEYKLTLTENSKKPDIEIIAKISKILGEEILFSIYPVLVEKIVNSEIYLGQGGNQFQKSDQYELFEKGEKIIDSYTNEVIGNVETLLGLIEITSVSTGYSKAKMLSKENNLPEDISNGSYLVRPIKIVNENNEKTFAENKEKIKKKKADKKKKLENEF
ncbi:CsgG/HfaB family protein [Candidatus Pelagibacter sp. Uisw_090]|uniref:CsgG/HfaB family protein n=1 Tax=Candidatus Pelagibacter sp. Uisw_090 TaxID=3230993 RepID=UPI0039E78470